MELNVFVLGNTEFTFFQNEKSYQKDSPLITPPHLHPFPEFFIALTGEAIISGDFGQRKITPQDICLMPPLIFHDTIANESYNRLAIPFIIREIDLQDGQLDTYRIFSEMLSATSPYIMPFNSAMLEDINSCLTEDKPFRREKMKNTISLIFIRIVQQLCESPVLCKEIFHYNKKDKYYETLIEIDGCTQFYYSNNMDYRSVCDNFYLTPRQISRIILSEYRRNVVDLRSETRMRQAKFYLENTNYSVAETSDLLGYSTRESFAITFKKHFNISPLKLRNSKNK